MQKLRKTDRRRRFLLPRVRREGGRARRADPKRYARVYCKNCGREVAANATLCPNCGAKIEPQNKKPINALGIAGFVLSLISLWGGSVFVVPIVGLILSAIGVAQREKYSSNGFATAGLVISIVTLVFWALMVALIVTGVVTGFFDAFFDAVYPSGAAAF